MLAGQMAYRRSWNSPDGTMATPRRNLHRFERSILMIPRRLPYASDDIGETTSAFVMATMGSGEGINVSEPAWPNNFKGEYFGNHRVLLAFEMHRRLYDAVLSRS